MANYFNARDVLKITIGEILNPWEPATASITPEQFRALDSMTPPSDELGGVEGAMQ